MSILGFISEIPLFSTISEARQWGEQYGIRGYHSHILLNRKGYMAGFTHKDITSVNIKRNVVSTPVLNTPQFVNLQQEQQQQQQPPTQVLQQPIVSAPQPVEQAPAFSNASNSSSSSSGSSGSSSSGGSSGGY